MTNDLPAWLVEVRAAVRTIIRPLIPRDWSGVIEISVFRGGIANVRAHVSWTIRGDEPKGDEAPMTRPTVLP